MKLLICLALFLGTLATITPTKGKEIVKQLQGIDLDGEIFVIFFYDPRCCADPKRTINDDVRKELQSKVLNTETGKKYIYYEVDTSDQDMDEVCRLLHIDEYQTLHGPTLLIAAEGSGFWAHGRDAADKIAKKAAQFDAIKQESLKKIKERNDYIY